MKASKPATLAVNQNEQRHQIWARNTVGYTPLPNSTGIAGAGNSNANDKENAALTEADRLILQDRDLVRGKAMAEKAVAQDPTLVTAYSLLNLCLLAEGNHTERVAMLKKGLKHRPDSGHLWFLLGHSYASLKQEKLALKSYSEALKHDLVELDSVHYNMGNVYYDFEKLEAARRCYENCLYINPDHLKAIHQLVGTCALLGNVPTAKAYANELLRKDAGGKEAAFARKALQMMEN